MDPDWPPKLIVAGPVTVRSPVPWIWPLVWFSVAAVDVPFRRSVPPLTPSVANEAVPPMTSSPPATFVVALLVKPLVTVSRPLWICSVALVTESEPIVLVIVA